MARKDTDPADNRLIRVSALHRTDDLFNLMKKANFADNEIEATYKKFDVARPLLRYQPPREEVQQEPKVRKLQPSPTTVGAINDIDEDNRATTAPSTTHKRSRRQITQQRRPREVTGP
eukprot:730263-Amphidinium_carterae.1